MVEKLLPRPLSLEKTKTHSRKMEGKFLESATELAPKSPEEPLETVKSAELEQSKPTIRGGTSKKLEALIEEECKCIIAEKGRAKVYQRLDQASRIYLLMTNFYPEPLVELLSCHVDFSPYTEDKAVNLFKELLEAILINFTGGWKHMEKLEPYIKETLAWQ